MKNSPAGPVFERLVEILATLRGPHGCPWDKEQTYKDINPYMVEEVYEVLEAIDQGNFPELKEELGDLLMHICFHAQLATEETHFTIADVIQSQCDKLIRRHPHVFGDEKAETPREVLQNWEKIKEGERKAKHSEKKSLLSGLPKGMPALVKALRIGEKTSRVGFDWENASQVMAKVDEERGELQQALQDKNGEAIEHELGDLLLSLVNLGRHLKIDSETALRKACDRWIGRFQWMEEKIAVQNRRMQEMTAAEWDRLWEEAKEATS